jgi:hypothetical protein
MRIIGWAPNSIPIYIQLDATLHSLFISGNWSTCFRWYFHPSSGAHTTLSTASGICHTVNKVLFYVFLLSYDILYFINILRLILQYILSIFLLKPVGHVMHHQFNIQQPTLCPHCIYVFCIYLRTNSDLCHLQHKLIGFYNRDEKCLQRGTDWVFK